MKLSRTAWIVLGIGIFVIVMAGLGMVYSQQTSERKKLADSLAVDQTTFPGLVTEEADWENQVANLQSELDRLESDLIWAQALLNSAKASFPTTVESIEYDEILFQFADDWQLEIRQLTASEPVNTMVEDISYSTTVFTVEVWGKPLKSSIVKIEEYIEQYREYAYRTVGNTLNFINAIATGEDFTTATVSSVDITVPEPLTEEEIDEVESLLEELEEGVELKVEFDVKPSATIELIIYSYEGE